MVRQYVRDGSAHQLVRPRREDPDPRSLGLSEFFVFAEDVGDFATLLEQR